LEVNDLKISAPSRHSSGRRIAVVGAGIAGLGCAWLLSKQHQVTLYEAAPCLGGHSHTVDVQIGTRSIAVDTGFIV
jgi:predicted NAD/FAD-binding protein